jgi:hypothetical protein
MRKLKDSDVRFVPIAGISDITLDVLSCTGLGGDPQVKMQKAADRSHVCVVSLPEHPLASTLPGQQGVCECHPVLFAVQRDRTTILAPSKNLNLIGGAPLSR